MRKRPAGKPTIDKVSVDHEKRIQKLERNQGVMVEGLNKRLEAIDITLAAMAEMHGGPAKMAHALGELRARQSREAIDREVFKGTFVVGGNLMVAAPGTVLMATKPDAPDAYAAFNDLDDKTQKELAGKRVGDLVIDGATLACIWVPVTK